MLLLDYGADGADGRVQIHYVERLRIQHRLIEAVARLHFSAICACFSPWPFSPKGLLSLVASPHRMSSNKMLKVWQYMRDFVTRGANERIEP